jgi:hypothetical protein
MEIAKYIKGGDLPNVIKYLDKINLENEDNEGQSLDVHETMILSLMECYNKEVLFIYLSL